MFDSSLFPSLIGFALVTCITPGPNNFMLMSSGALFGWRRTLPHIVGIQTGFVALMAASVLGLGLLLTEVPLLVTAVKVAGAAWLSWLALKFFIAAFGEDNADNPGEITRRSRPFRVHEAAFFQWANPKALVMTLSAAGAYTGLSSNLSLRALIICGTFALIGVVSALTWTLAGASLNRFMSAGPAARALNAIMGLLLLATALVILMARTTITTG